MRLSIIVSLFSASLAVAQWCQYYCCDELLLAYQLFNVDRELLHLPAGDIGNVGFGCKILILHGFLS